VSIGHERTYLGAQWRRAGAGGIIDARAMGARDTWRCFWTWPPGHRFEVIPYFDGVAGRWAAFGRCACCDKLRGLAVGHAVSGAVFANQPLATGLSRQGVKHSAPPSATSTTGAPADEGGFADIALGDGLRLYVRRAVVSSPLRGERRVYVAHVIGAAGLRRASPSLERAVGRALRDRPGSPRLAGVLAQLEHELVS
jgi:hypothetical protein